jgi:hypothetical protein
MNRMLWKPLAAFAVLAAFAPAHAQMRQRVQDSRADFDRNFAPPQQAETLRDPPPQQGLMPGRMTPEERRQLRRDIHEAGRELYRGGPPPQGVPPR